MSGAGDRGPGRSALATVPVEHLRLLIETIRDYAIFMLDPQGRVATWNAGARAIKGYSEDEIVGRHISTFYTEEDRALQRPQRLLAAALAHGRV